MSVPCALAWWCQCTLFFGGGGLKNLHRKSQNLQLVDFTPWKGKRTAKCLTKLKFVIFTAVFYIEWTLFQFRLVLDLRIFSVLPVFYQPQPNLHYYFENPHCPFNRCVVMFDITCKNKSSVRCLKVFLGYNKSGGGGARQTPNCVAKVW